MNQHEIIADILVHSIVDDLFPIYQNWLDFYHPGVTLNVRAGFGLATHFYYDPNKDEYFITIGKKMVKCCISSSKIASRWTQGIEITERKYYKGELSIQNVLAHSIIHEFAHFIKHLKFGHGKNSVHKSDFYNILDNMHNQYNIGTIILNKLNKNEVFSGLSFLNDDKYISKYNKNNILKKSKILFNSDDGVISATVKRRNNDIVTADTDTHIWSVPYESIIENTI